MKGAKGYLDDIRVHHIGIKSSDINKDIMLYKALGYKPISEFLFDINQNIKIIFMRSFDGMQVIELIEALNKTSSIYGCKDGFHHICYEVDSISEIVCTIKKRKMGKAFTKIMSAPALENRNIIFMCLNNGMFVEFLFDTIN